MESYLAEFLEMKRGVYGAMFWSEQAPESCQKDFEAEWEDNNVMETHPEYLGKLKKQVVRYNCKHM